MIFNCLVGFLDLKENMTNIEAWDLLVNSVLQVVQTLNQPDTVLDIFNTRYSGQHKIWENTDDF